LTDETIDEHDHDNDVHDNNDDHRMGYVIAIHIAQGERMTKRLPRYCSLSTLYYATVEDTLDHFATQRNICGGGRLLREMTYWILAQFHNAMKATTKM
jgi:hypothetical protein